MNKLTFFPLLAGIALAGLLTGCKSRSPVQTTSSDAPASVLAPMPEGVTSFGAVTTHDGWLYTFGGHKGERHEYFAEKVSGSFYRLRLSEGRSWELLPEAAPGQGQPLVTDGKYVYRIGGMAARNHEGEKQDLFSTTLSQRFNVQNSQWENLPPLPAPRSSHDAVIVGDKLYIFGGWQLAGGTNKPAWPANAYVLDLADVNKGWKEFPQPFQRRALAVAALGSRVFCIGGMDSNNEGTLAVEIYDIASGRWTKGPDLPPGKHKGFSCSAISQDGRIYANAFQGDVLRLAAEETSWEVVGRLQHPRMSHRLVRAGNKQLIALGGEDGEDKRPDLELITPAATLKIAANVPPPIRNTAHQN
jgi:hypothetical protein